METNKIYCMDALEFLSKVDDKSIDMILCDLPYGTTACSWDTIIPFEPLWKQYKRIIKDNGAIVLTASQPFTSALVMSNPKLFKYEVIFKKNIPSNPLLAKKQILKYHENICVFYKTQPTFNPETKNRTEGNFRKNKKAEYEQRGVFGNTKMTAGDGEKEWVFEGSVIEIISRDRGLHPTQKPVELFEKLIRTFTNEGDLVLDNTAGSGTTAISCLNTNRQFIVMEKEQKYYDIILKRVEDFNKKFEQQTLFGNEM